MTRGKIVIIKDGTIFSSIEFNGDMYPSGNGELAIHLLSNLYDSDSSGLKADFENKVKDFAHKCYSYKDETTIVHSRASVRNGHFEELMDMENNYMNNWFSDYLYIRNFDDEAYCMHTRDVSVNLKKDTIYVLYFGELKDSIKIDNIQVQKQDEDELHDIALYDEVYDSDALIHGVVIELTHSSYFVLWDNEVIGKVNYNDKTVNTTSKNYRQLVHSTLLHRNENTKVKL